MSEQPLVSVICLCHNQGKYVAEAIESVWLQEHENVELIIVDDASSDSSREEILAKIEGTDTVFISLEENHGNCKAFNIGFKKSNGTFIIDLAADDYLLPNRISEGLKAFSDGVGVDFSDAMLLDESGNYLRTHFRRSKTGSLLTSVPEGNIYQELIQRYFVSAPTMMIKREVLEQMGGYDEDLSYEDFDFWIRSSRNWAYNFTDQVLVKKRILQGSHSSKQFVFRSNYQKSTLTVCQKIKDLNNSKEEDSALRKRCWYEIRQCLRHGNWGLIPAFWKLI